MPDVSVDNFYESDSSDNEEQHSKLINSVSQLDSTQRVKPALRKEVSSEISEYTLPKVTTKQQNLVNVKELAGVLNDKSQNVSISKKIKKVTQKSKTLPKPLEKPLEEKLKRAVGFIKVKDQLRRWDAIVTRNALKDQIKFPLNSDSIKMQKTNEFLNKFKVSTPLEAEIAKVLKQDNETEEKEETEEFPLTLQEMLEKRKEMAQLRAKLSYKQAKAQRQNKIKSKKYHRILKREKVKQQIKEFEALQKTNPEAALKKLEELDKNRAHERASLRHRNTGQWAKNLKVRAKYNVESRKVLADQLKMSREITQKVHRLDSSDEENNTETTSKANPHQNLVTDKNNPWGLNVAEEVESFVSGYRKYWEEKNKENGLSAPKEKETESNSKQNKQIEEKVIEAKKQNGEIKKAKKKRRKRKKVEGTTSLNGEIPSKKIKSEKGTTVSVQSSSGVWIVTPVPGRNNSNKKKKDKPVPDIDNLFEELGDKLQRKAEKKIKKMKGKLKGMKKEKEKKKTKEKQNKEFDLSFKNSNVVDRPDEDVGLNEGDEEVVPESTSYVPLNNSISSSPPEIDPKNFIQVKPKKLNSELPENVIGGDETMDDETQMKTIEEAFGDDDVVAEFSEMKKEEEESNQIEMSTTLPGWGEWGGTGIAPNPRKKRRIVLNLPPKRETKKEDTIINENENPNIKNHLVKEVPHPFKSVDAFEANIRAPIGRDWVPETAHQKLIQKSVETKLGTIIEPMSEDEIIRMKKAHQSPFKGKTKDIKK